MSRPWSWFRSFRVVSATFVLAALSPCRAQKVSVRGPEPAQVVLGDRADLKVVFEGEGNPSLVRPPRIRGLEVEVRGPNVLTSSTMVNGVWTERREISWVLRLRPRRTGRFEIPSLVVKEGGRSFRTKKTVLHCVEDLFGKEAAFLEADMEPAEPWLRQAVRIRVRFGLDRSLIGRLVSRGMSGLDLPVRLQAPWLDRFPAGLPPEDGKAQETEGSSLALNDHAARARPLDPVERDGRVYAVFEISRRFLVDRLGEGELEAPKLAFEVATRIGTDFFGQRVARETRRVFAHGKPLRFRVRPLPEKGRPEGFTNAVGRFTLHASCGRRKLRVGESFPLVLELRGTGNLEFVEMPELSDLPGFHRFGRKITRENGVLRAVYDLAVLDDRVKAVPPIPFGAFDPERGVYRDLRTDPIPLEVRPSRGAAKIEALPEAGEALTPGVDDIFDRIPVETPLDPPHRPGLLEILVLWLGPWLLLGAGLRFVERRRRFLRDPGLRARREAFRRFEERLSREGAMRAFAGLLTDRFGIKAGEILDPTLRERLERAGLSGDLAREAIALRDALEGSRYGGGGEEGLAGRVRTFADRVRKEVGS